MKIDFASDIHLEFGNVELLGGDLLILAGDIAEVKQVCTAYNKLNKKPYIPGFNKYIDFFETECAKYNQVLYVFGNHEHYGSRVDKSFRLAKTVLPDHIKILENQSVVINNIKFFGATLWTDMNKRNPIAIHDAKSNMNDYRYIQFKDRHDRYGKLHPHDTVDLHVQSMNNLREELKKDPMMPTVVISHHAPSYSCLADWSKTSITAPCYASELSEFVLDHPNINLWVFGHTHEPADVKIGNTRIVSNPRGYYGYETMASSFEVKSVDMCI